MYSCRVVAVEYLKECLFGLSLNHGRYCTLELSTYIKQSEQ